MRRVLGLLLSLLAAAQVWGAAPTDSGDPRLVAAKLPHLAAAIRRGGGRLCWVAGGSLSANGDGTAKALARRLSTSLGGPVGAAVIAAERLGAACADGLVSEAVAAARADLTVLDVGAIEPAAPPAAAAAALLPLVRALGQAGADVLVLTPRPTAATPPALRTALSAAAVCERTFGPYAQVVDGAQALWPEEVLDPEGAVTAFGRLLADGQVTAEGSARLVEHIRRQLASADDGRPLELTCTMRLRPGAESLVGVRLHNRTELGRRARVLVLSPLELAATGAIESDVGPSAAVQHARSVRLPAAASLTDDLRQAHDWGGNGVVCGMIFTAPGPSRLFRCPLRTTGLSARVESGRSAVVGSATVSVLVEDTSGRPRNGYLTGLPGRPVQAFALESQAGLAIPLGLPLPAETRGRLCLVAEAVADEERSPAIAAVRYSAAAFGRPETARIDGDLGDWTGDSWYSVAAVDQVVEGRERWRFEADASLRWAARAGNDGLQLALVVTDDLLTDGDQVDLLWDARPGAELGRGGPARRLSLGLRQRALRGRGAEKVRSAWSAAGHDQVVEIEVPWEVIGRRPDPTEWLGFDLRLMDDDGPQGRHCLVWTGEPWSAVDATRLGLLQLGGTPQRAVRLLVGLDD